MEDLVLDNGYKLVFEKELVHSELYEHTGYILKDDDLLDNFNGIGLFDTYEDVKIELMKYLINIEKVEITKDNIHLYYEFMSDEDKFNYSKHIKSKNIELVYPFMNDALKKHHFDNIDLMFSKRKSKLIIEFGTDHKIICKSELFKAKDYFILSEDSYFNTSLKAFEVEDTLKPIDEYIEEIKSSDAYKEYINPIVSIDTSFSLDDTMSFLNTDDHQEETICTIDLRDGISVDIQYFDVGTKASLKLFIFRADGTGDYVPMDGNFYSIQKCIEYIKSMTIQDLKKEL